MSEFEKMLSFVKAAWPAREFIVPCLAGPPGIGKTMAIRQAAQELSEADATGRVITIIASQILPNEVSGITMPVPETKAMEIFDHYRLSSLRDGDILFFDELLEADQMVLSACLTLIESRELMSGAKLPDIMIVAATNMSISSQLLKLNIRQRFVWQNFELDKPGTQQYIFNQFSIDVGPKVTAELTTDGTGYNVLTPRSLTKMVGWISSAGGKAQAKAIAVQINRCWNNGIGQELYRAWLKAFGVKDKDTQTREAVASILQDVYYGTDYDELPQELVNLTVVDDDIESDVTIGEMIDILQASDKWEEIQTRLADLKFEEEDDEIF